METKEKQQFTGDMTIKAALDLHPDVSLVLSGYHLGGCSQCGVNKVETIAQACNSYGVPVDAILSSLNDLLDE